jgi:SAM-dependent methyltransferase
MAGSHEPRPDWYRTSFDELYPLLYAHRTQKEAIEFLVHLSAKIDLQGGWILDLGCGEGRYLHAMSERGFAPVGIDLSAPLLGLARSRLPLVPLIRADMRSLPMRERSFRRVLLMFTTFGYFPTIAEDRRVLSEIARVLVPGGGLVLDYVNARHVRENLVARSGRLVRGMSAEERRWIDPAGPYLWKETRIGPMRDGTRRVYQERLRLYEPGEIEEMLLACRFRIEERIGDYRGRPFDPGRSPRLLLLALREEGGQ